MGFTDIDWVEHTENAEALSHRIENTLRKWLKNPIPPSSAQVAGAQEQFEANTQYEKMRQVYLSYMR
jgi:hypothetical protein